MREWGRGFVRINEPPGSVIETNLNFNEARDDGVAVASAWPCKSFAPCSRQITKPATHHSIFTSRMPTNSVKALKTITVTSKTGQISSTAANRFIVIQSEFFPFYYNTVIIRLTSFCILSFYVCILHTVSCIKVVCKMFYYSSCQCSFLAVLLEFQYRYTSNYWSIDWLIDWLIDCLIDWTRIDWLS